MRQVWEWVRQRALQWLSISSTGWVLLGLAVVGGAFIVMFDSRSKAYAPPDAIALQLAFSSSVFEGVVTQWGPVKTRAFLDTLGQLDFVFPLVYASLLGGLYVWLSGKLGAPTWRFLKWAPWLAAAFDWIENVLQIWLIGKLPEAANGDAFRAGVLSLSLCAAAKWTLVTRSVLGTVAVLLRSDVGWALWTCRFGLLSVLIGSLPLIVTSQGQDLLRVVADDALSTTQTVVTYGMLLLWATSVWYWSRVLLQIRWREGEPSGDADRSPAGREIAVWLPRTLGTATLLLAGFAFLRTASGEDRWHMAFHAVCCLALAVAFFYVVKLRRHLLNWPPDPLRVETWRDLPPSTRSLAKGALLVSALFLVLFVLAPIPVGRGLGGPAIVFLAAANAVFFGSGSVLVSRAYRIPAVAFALGAAAVFSGWNDNHAVRLLGTDRVADRPQLRSAFETWARPRLEQWTKENKHGPMPVFLVAAEGGGVRAAYWAAIVLGRLQDHNPIFARQVFGISGVSGGSLGAAVYAALLRDGTPVAGCRAPAPPTTDSNGSPLPGPFETCAQEVLRQDLLAPGLGRLVATDFLQWFVPVPVPFFDRARAIEDSWSAAYAAVTGRNTLDQPFLSVSEPRPPATVPDDLSRPALLLNGTHVHTGQRLLRAPFTWPNGFPKDPTEAQMPDITDLTALLGADVRLSTAAHDSARFAYFSPAGRLLSSQGRAFGHIVDGGYFENSGAVTLKDILLELRDSSLASQVEFMVVYLCNNSDRCYGRAVSPDPARAQSRPPGLGEAFSPVRALLGARDARGSLAIAHMKQAERRFFEFGVCPIEKEPAVPLGWQLSERMRVRLSEQVAGKRAKGNEDAALCVKLALEGMLGPPDSPETSACKPAFSPDRGCRSETE